MAEETLSLVPYDSLAEDEYRYTIDFSDTERHAPGLKYRFGTTALAGPVAYKTVLDGTVGPNEAAVLPRLRREMEVARCLGDARGGARISKCLAYRFTHAGEAAVLVTYAGEPLADLGRDQQRWPLSHTLRVKLATDLLEALETLRVSGVVHGALGLDTLLWDGSTLQIAEFGQASLRGSDPDGRTAHPGDDIAAAGRVLYEVYTGYPPPDDPRDLRRQIEEVQDTSLRNLLLRRDLVSGTDHYYAFDADPDRRPTPRTLLDRLDERPLDKRREELLRRDREVRADFRALRERQERFRRAYARWTGSHRSAVPPGPVPRAPGTDSQTAPWTAPTVRDIADLESDRRWPRWAAPVAVVVVLVIVLLVVRPL